jgi:hypothetical protein
MSCSTFKTLQVSFAAPEITPANGYLVKWRAVGATTWNEVTQFGNPVTIAGVPACFNIEGTIQANCGNGNLGQPINFAATGGTTVCYSFTLNNTGNYTYIPCGEVDQTITVSNNANSPTQICAKDGTVTGGSFTRTVQCTV